MGVKEKKEVKEKETYGPKMMEEEMWLSLFHQKNRYYYIYAGY